MALRVGIVTPTFGPVMKDCELRTSFHLGPNSAAIRHFYFFQPTLTQHVHLYYSWVMAARAQQIDMRLLTLMPWRRKRIERELVKYWAAQDSIEIRAVWVRYARAVEAFFLKQCRNEDQVVVHLRKQPVEPFVRLRERTNGRLRFLVEFEGDFVSEADYLRAHPYRPGFYDETLRGYDQAIARQRAWVEAADGVLVVSTLLRDLLCKRFRGIGLEERITVIPTGASIVGTGPDESARLRIRRELEWDNAYVVLYAGNVRYSWQSLSSSLGAFKVIKRRVHPEAVLLLLIPLSDWPIAQDFLARARIPRANYRLLEVPQHEVAAFVAASDLGLLLRPSHPATRCGSPGKFGDYVLGGLPVLMSEGCGDYADLVTRHRVFPLLADIDDEEAIVRCAGQLGQTNWGQRAQIAAWGREHISSSSHAEHYAGTLRKVSRRAQ